MGNVSFDSTVSASSSVNNPFSGIAQMMGQTYDPNKAQVSNVMMYQIIDQPKEEKAPLVSREQIEAMVSSSTKSALHSAKTDYGQLESQYKNAFEDFMKIPGKMERFREIEGGGKVDPNVASFVSPLDSINKKELSGDYGASYTLAAKNIYKDFESSGAVIVEQTKAAQSNLHAAQDAYEAEYTILFDSVIVS